MANMGESHQADASSRAAHRTSGMSDRTWTIVGTVSTIWAIVVALILAMLAHISTWLSHNSSWFTPILIFVLVCLPLVCGYLLGGTISPDARRRGVAPVHDLHEIGSMRHFANVNAVLEREAQAKVIWIISPRLFYDIYDPDFRRVVLNNKARNVLYRYIVPDNAEVRKNITTYREVYRETEEEQMANFVVLPDSGLAEFLTEVAIYDPGEPTMYGFAAPPSPRSGREDVMILSREVRHHFAKAFSDIWYAAKNSLP